MFTGQVAAISNRATWTSETFELVDPSDNTTTDLTNPDLDLDIVVTIEGLLSGLNSEAGINSNCIFATASIANGKVSVPGPGFNWRFEVSDLENLCAGTYRLVAIVTINGSVDDTIDGTLAVRD